MAGDRICKLEELKGLIEEGRRDNHNRKEENKNMKSSIDNLMKEVPMARTTLMELDKKRSQQEEEFQKLNNTYQELKEKLRHLEDQKKLLHKRIVPNEEFEGLEKQLQQLKLGLAEHESNALNYEANLNKCKESNAKVQNLSKEIEMATDIITLRLIEQQQEANKQLNKAKKEEHELQVKCSTMVQEIEQENQTRQSLEQEQQHKKQQFEVKQHEQNKILNAKKILLKEKTTKLQQLEKENEVLLGQVEEQKDIAQYLEENISEILKDYED